MKDKFVGAFLGLIVGDALGAPYEGMQRGEFQFNGELKRVGPDNIKAGQWTDDSSMALCLAESLIDDGFNLKSQLNKYAEWFEHGHLSSKERAFKIGRNTSLAITDFIKKSTLPPEREYAAGNGSLMRLAPVPLYFCNDFDKAVYYAKMSSLSTHNNIMAADSCKFLGAFIYHALKNKSKEYLLESSFKKLDLDKRVLDKVKGNYKFKEKKDIISDAFVLNTLEASLWSFYQTDNFAAAIKKAINLGGDTDTVAAVTGQMAGAFYGRKEILNKWINNLVKKKMIIQIITKLYQVKISE